MIHEISAKHHLFSCRNGLVDSGSLEDGVCKLVVGSNRLFESCGIYCLGLGDNYGWQA